MIIITQYKRNIRLNKRLLRLRLVEKLIVKLIEKVHAYYNQDNHFYETNK